MNMQLMQIHEFMFFQVSQAVPRLDRAAGGKKRSKKAIAGGEAWARALCR
jgi:hypothetical protein